MSEDPFGEGGSIGVTLKQGKGYEAPWITVKGSSAGEVRKHLEDVTGLSGEGITLASLVYNAADHFQKVGEVGTVLGATVIRQDAPTETPTESASSAAPAAEQEPEAPEAQFASAIASVENLAALGDLYLKNKDAFDGDEKLMAALQARSAQLK